jgi:hypothetical protein
MIQLFIGNKEDRRLVMAILADNGYTVRLGKVKVGKTSKIAVEAWKDEEKTECAKE